MDGDGLRQLGHRAVDLAFDHLEGRPGYRSVPPELRRLLQDAPLPEAGQPVADILERVATQVLPYPMGNASPRFFAWVNSPPAPVGVLGDLLAAAMNPACTFGDHADVYVERCAVRWLSELVGFGGGTGLLTSGGSMASLTCIAAARHRAARQDGWDVRADGLQGGHAPLSLYVSEDGHNCLRKAAELLGLGSRAVRLVPMDGEFRMDVGALAAMLAADRAAGWRPFCVAASAGTTNTGAIDPLDELVDLCAAEGLWLHVDGAYGAFAALDPEVAPRLAALGRADSLALDPHKWLQVPLECGCALVRDAELLRAAFTMVPPYLRDVEGRPGFDEYGFQQTRGFRALKLWMGLQEAGRSGCAEMVMRHRRLARHLEGLLGSAPDFEVVAPVTLSVVCFRHAPAGLDAGAVDDLQRAVASAVQAGGEAYLTSSVLGGRPVLRACILHRDTSEEDIAALVDVVRRAGRALASA